MTLITEENNRSSGGGLSLIIWLILLVGIAIGAYYIFFKKPELVLPPPPSNIREAELISKMRFDPNDLASDPRFTKLLPGLPDLQPPPAGRSNPFAPF